MDYMAQPPSINRSSTEMAAGPGKWSALEGMLENHYFDPAWATADTPPVAGTAVGVGEAAATAIASEALLLDVVVLLLLLLGPPIATEVLMIFLEELLPLPLFGAVLLPEDASSEFWDDLLLPKDD